MIFPALFTVGLHSYVQDAPDAYGVPEGHYEPPLDEPGTPYKVVSWVTQAATAGLGASEAEDTSDRNRVVLYAQLFAPVEFPATPYDMVEFEGLLFEILGAPEDFTHGPWWNSGVKVWNLRRVTG